jgi:hypothetical protein
MAVRTVRTRVCDVQDCTESAERLELSRAGIRYALDLCVGHQELVWALPWQDLPDGASTPAERASARMARSLEQRVRIPEGFDLDEARRRHAAGG